MDELILALKLGQPEILPERFSRQTLPCRNIVSIYIFYLTILMCTVKPGLTLLKTICHVDKIAQASAMPPASITVASIAKII